MEPAAPAEVITKQPEVVAVTIRPDRWDAVRETMPQNLMLHRVPGQEHEVIYWYCMARLVRYLAGEPVAIPPPPELPEYSTRGAIEA